MMNRTLRRELFGVGDMPPGGVLVATEVIHPLRGQVRCPAAALVAATVWRLGQQVRFGPLQVGSFRRDGGHQAGAVAHVTSYVRRDGVVVGLAAAAHPRTPDAVVAASEAVAEWTRVLRTRHVGLTPVGRLATPGAGAVAARPGADLVHGPLAPGVDFGDVFDRVAPASPVGAAAPGIALTGADVTFVLGDPDSPQTRKAAEAAYATGSMPYVVADVSGLRSQWIGAASRVGLAVSASADADLTSGVLRALSGLGPLRPAGASRSAGAYVAKAARHGCGL